MVMNILFSTDIFAISISNKYCSFELYSSKNPENATSCPRAFNIGNIINILRFAYYKYFFEEPCDTEYWSNGYL